MIRLEIIANQAIEEDIIEALSLNGFGENFTYINHVYGRGGHGRREGSAIWPEENVIFILITEENRLDPLMKELRSIKNEFSMEGMQCYIQKDVNRLI